MNNFNLLTNHAEQAASMLKEIANRHRLMICCCLGDKEMSVSELNTLVPLSQSALSQHLARMRSAKLVTTRKEQQTVYYKMHNENISKVMSTLQSIYSQ